MHFNWKILFLFTLIPSFCLAQENENDLWFQIKATPYLNMRNKPDKSGEIIGKIPDKAIVLHEENDESIIPDTIGGKAGFWYECYYNPDGLRGWLFGPYLVPFQANNPNSESDDLRFLLNGYNDFHTEFEPNFHWYALTHDEQTFQSQLRETEFTLSTEVFYFEPGGDFVSYVNLEVQEDQSGSLYLGSKSPLKTNRSIGQQYISRPGQQDYRDGFLLPEEYLVLSAPGCPEMVLRAFIDSEGRYQLEINEKETFPTDPYEMDVISTPETPGSFVIGQLSSGTGRMATAVRNPSLDWYGDLNQDGRMDLIFYLTNEPIYCVAYSAYIIVLSDPYSDDPTDYEVREYGMGY